MYRKYILEKNWSKTTIPALGSGQTENDTPIWGRRHQLDDQNRNPNMNNRDHLVGRPTSVKYLLDVWISTTAHILETKSELDKDLWSSKSCY